ncbi:MAG TPA: DUF1223 domain-containing protein [Caulobacteraceae bacterium]|nr:DUF1223 domain-containing protein [Caulobacteraceae bacterium]
MKRIAPLSLLFLLAAPMMTGAAQARPPGAPVVVELFTAQGCSDCPEANQLLMRLADDEDVIALTFPVDYWDYLGWKDTFARPEFSARQRAYRKAMNLRDVYTPQIVVDGARQLTAVEADEVEAAVREEARRPVDPPDMQFLGRDRVAVGTGKVPRGGASVWLVRYDDHVQEVAVRRGENRGQTVRHGNVVRQLVKVGDWRGRPKLFRLPEAQTPDLETVVLVQANRTGRIVAAGRR